MHQDNRTLTTGTHFPAPIDPPSGWKHTAHKGDEITPPHQEKNVQKKKKRPEKKKAPRATSFLTSSTSLALAKQSRARNVTCLKCPSPTKSNTTGGRMAKPDLIRSRQAKLDRKIYLSRTEDLPLPIRLSKSTSFVLFRCLIVLRAIGLLFQFS